MENKLLKIILIIFISNTIISCKGQDNVSEFATTWHEIKKKENNYYMVDCGYEGNWIKIQNDSIYDHGIMEENIFKIKRIAKENSSTSFYIDEKEKYELIWVDKDKGVIILKNGLDNNLLKYFVNEAHLKNIKKIKGTSKDCIISEEE